ncbi:hypothetical protein OG625_11320 [Streptomyces sp. NBC_01351]|uniref:hypothetical protein n=1 Tax=Streptomyces sp. NBC_01351 TaxID=2903833 RepID=UPI002E37C53E|nr:hypothetical protein [Streptomyces sp. NBC_01351]
MEELAYVAGRIVKGFAGLAYVFGETLVGLGPDGKDQERKKKREGEADEER